MEEKGTGSRFCSIDEGTVGVSGKKVVDSSFSSLSADDKEAGTVIILMDCRREKLRSLLRVAWAKEKHFSYEDVTHKNVDRTKPFNKMKAPSKVMTNVPDQAPPHEAANGSLAQNFRKTSFSGRDCDLREAEDSLALANHHLFPREGESLSQNRTKLNCQCCSSSSTIVLGLSCTVIFGLYYL